MFSYYTEQDSDEERPGLEDKMYEMDIRISEAANAVMEAQRRLDLLKAERAGLEFQCELQQNDPGANLPLPKPRKKDGLRKNRYEIMRSIAQPKWTNYRMIDIQVINYMKMNMDEKIIFAGREYIRLTELPEYSTMTDHTRSNCIYCDKNRRSHGNSSFPYKAFCEICAGKVVYVGPKI